jgi:hypothetical protein
LYLQSEYLKHFWLQSGRISELESENSQLDSSRCELDSRVVALSERLEQLAEEKALLSDQLERAKIAVVESRLEVENLEGKLANTRISSSPEQEDDVIGEECLTPKSSKPTVKTGGKGSDKNPTRTAKSAKSRGEPEKGKIPSRDGTVVDTPRQPAVTGRRSSVVGLGKAGPAVGSVTPRARRASIAVPPSSGFRSGKAPFVVSSAGQ